jgi:hypothetical protein
LWYICLFIIINRVWWWWWCWYFFLQEAAIRFFFLALIFYGFRWMNFMRIYSNTFFWSLISVIVIILPLNGPPFIHGITRSNRVINLHISIISGSINESFEWKWSREYITVLCFERTFLNYVPLFSISLPKTFETSDFKWPLKSVFLGPTRQYRY